MIYSFKANMFAGEGVPGEAKPGQAKTRRGCGEDDRGIFREHCTADPGRSTLVACTNRVWHREEASDLDFVMQKFL